MIGKRPARRQHRQEQQQQGTGQEQVPITAKGGRALAVQEAEQSDREPGGDDQPPLLKSGPTRVQTVDLGQSDGGEEGGGGEQGGRGRRGPSPDGDMEGSEREQHHEEGEADAGIDASRPTARIDQRDPEGGEDGRRHQEAGLGRPGHCSTSTTTTVTLSWPPARLASSIRAQTASSGVPSREKLGDPFVLDHVGETVRADEEPVAGDRSRSRSSRSRVGGDPEDPGQHAALGVGGGVGRGDVAGGQLFGDDGVVIGDLLEDALLAKGRRGCRRHGRDG